jgi:hypothetical protein
MSSKWRRFEVLLPLQFNDGSDVPAELLAEAVLEIVVTPVDSGRHHAAKGIG